MGLRDGTNIQEAQPKLRKGKESLYIISVKRVYEMGMHLFGKEGKLLGEKVLKELCAT